MLKKMLVINGLNKTVIVDPKSTLADVLRRQLGQWRADSRVTGLPEEGSSRTG